MQVIIRQNSNGDFELVKIEDGIESVLMTHNNKDECIKYCYGCGFDVPSETV